MATPLVGSVVLFFETFVDSTTVSGDLDDSFTSSVFLFSALFGDSVEFKLLAIIDGFSKIFGIICGELPNFGLLSASGLLNELNDRNSVLSVGFAPNRKQDESAPPKRLFNPLDFGDNGFEPFVSGLN